MLVVRVFPKALRSSNSSSLKALHRRAFQRYKESFNKPKFFFSALIFEAKFIKTRFIVFKLQIAYNNIKSVIVFRHHNSRATFPFAASIELGMNFSSRSVCRANCFIPSAYFIRVALHFLVTPFSPLSRAVPRPVSIAKAQQTTCNKRLEILFYDFCKANNNEFHCSVACCCYVLSPPVEHIHHRTTLA